MIYRNESCVTVNGMEQKTIVKKCAFCNKDFVGARSTAKFCSDACKVANHREKKAKLESYKQMSKQIRNLAVELENKETSYSAAITLDSLRRTLDMYFPPKTRWWRCDGCGKAVMKFLPDTKDCDCGSKSKWYIKLA